MRSGISRNPTRGYRIEIRMVPVPSSRRERLMRFGGADEFGNTMVTRAVLPWARIPSVHAALLIHLATLACVNTSVAGNESYRFSAWNGDTVTIRWRSDTAEYAFVSGDVTVSVVHPSSCDKRHFRICFTESDLDSLRALAIPIDPPDEGSTWRVDHTHYRLQGIIHDLTWLGRTFAEVYVIAIRADLTTGSRHFDALFSYAEGLLAFHESTGRGGAPHWFLASQLPSLGSSEARER